MTTTDPHGLIASGVELLGEPELAKALGVSRSALGMLLAGALYRVIPHVRIDGKRRYRLDDVRTALAPFLPGIRERARLAAEREARERLEGAARRKAKAEEHARHLARKHGPPTRPATGPGAPGPLPPQGKRGKPARGNVVPRFSCEGGRPRDRHWQTDARRRGASRCVFAAGGWSPRRRRNIVLE